MAARETSPGTAKPTGMVGSVDAGAMAETGSMGGTVADAAVAEGTTTATQRTAPAATVGSGV